MNSFVIHGFKVLSASQVPKLVEETELSLLDESVHDYVEVLLGGLSRDLLVIIEHFNVDYSIFGLYSVRQLPHRDHQYEEKEQNLDRGQVNPTHREDWVEGFAFVVWVVVECQPVVLGLLYKTDPESFTGLGILPGVKGL